jgi:hypothetical protein
MVEKSGTLVMGGSVRWQMTEENGQQHYSDLRLIANREAFTPASPRSSGRAAARRGRPRARAGGGSEAALHADGVVGLAESDVDAPVRADQAGGRLRCRAGHGAQPHGLAFNIDIITVKGIAGAALGHDRNRPRAVIAALGEGRSAYGEGCGEDRRL